MVIMNVASMVPETTRAVMVPDIARSMHAAGFNDVVAFPVPATGNIILWAVEHDDWGPVSFPEHLLLGVMRRWMP